MYGSVNWFDLCRESIGGAVRGSAKFRLFHYHGEGKGLGGMTRHRKQPGSVPASIGGQTRVSLSQRKFRIRPYKVPARERIQAPRRTAHVVARVAKQENLDVLSLPQTSHGPANAPRRQSDSPRREGRQAPTRCVKRGLVDRPDAGAGEAPCFQAERFGA